MDGRVLFALQGKELVLCEEGEVGVEDVFAGALEEGVAFLDLVEVVVVVFALLCVVGSVLMLKIYSDCSWIFFRMSACSCFRKSFILRRRSE